MLGALGLFACGAAEARWPHGPRAPWPTSSWLGADVLNVLDADVLDTLLDTLLDVLDAKPRNARLRHLGRTDADEGTHPPRGRSRRPGRPPLPVKRLWSGGP